MRTNIKILISFVILLTFLVTGCQTGSDRLVNSKNLPGHTYEKYMTSDKSHAVTRLSNGVILYKDNSSYSSSKSSFVINPDAPGVKFGPDDIRFEPKNVNPR